MKLALLILILTHLSGPGLAEAPEVTEVQGLRARVKQMERYELWWVRAGRPELIKPKDF
ncbi:MAG: hypothetical protein ABIK28_08980 [Planctomycetota bacterium]